MNEGDVRSYISSNLKRGLSSEEVKQCLLCQGVSDLDIENGFSDIEVEKRKVKSLGDYC